ncbi:Sec-independent protein translocase protein TatB [Beijerinckia indica]|uniref:Sec-independent protein translocase protein TatB n=1 Tax=Beijerinckia indica subsp. indica (strain ATCC 9039 / DSM 1715 / NCIMB 8712) TaxID=395963 RepID=B2IJG3_BEII9|nr:Sec-independent protein translocase protein TatB [Beijerinckia indica]ACB96276.1 twin-arginine translocation protein, TatB subunit [Beijerinckia indica subsp. indica ATCC 9039]
MFDFDPGKLIIIGIVALIVIGPKDLPRVMRQVGQAVGKMRRMAADFQAQFMQAMHEADMAEIRENMQKLGESAKIEANFQPLQDVKSHLTGAVASLPAAPVAPESPPSPEPTEPVSLPAPEPVPSPVSPPESAASISPAPRESSSA